MNTAFTTDSRKNCKFLHVFFLETNNNHCLASVNMTLNFSTEGGGHIITIFIRIRFQSKQAMCWTMWTRATPRGDTRAQVWPPLERTGHYTAVDKLTFSQVGQYLYLLRDIHTSSAPARQTQIFKQVWEIYKFRTERFTIHDISMYDCWFMLDLPMRSKTCVHCTKRSRFTWLIPSNEDMSIFWALSVCLSVAGSDSPKKRICWMAKLEGGCQTVPVFRIKINDKKVCMSRFVNLSVLLCDQKETKTSNCCWWSWNCWRSWNSWWSWKRTPQVSPKQ